MAFPSFLSRILRPKSDSTLERLITAVYGGNGTATGIAVDDKTALEVGAVYSCIQVLSQAVAQTPLHLYKEVGEAKEKAKDHYLYRLLHDDPNDWMTSYQMKQLIMVVLLLRGNSLWLKSGVSGSKIRELIPIHPDLVQGAQQDERYRLSYKVKRPGTGTVDTIPREKVVHFMGLSLNGYWGITPITYAREMIGLAKATEKHGAKLFSNGARLGGVLKHPSKISKEAHERLLNSWNDAYSGVENAHKTALLEEGMAWEKMTMTAEDSQFLESRKFQRSEIAGFYRVPAHMINDLEKATFSNVEHLDLSFVKHSLTPWIVSIEQTLRKDLLSEKEKVGLFFKFNVDGLLRGDIKSRFESYQLGILNGIISPNEAREKEELPPYKGGEIYRMPLNTAPSGENSNEPKKTPEN